MPSMDRKEQVTKKIDINLVVSMLTPIPNKLPVKILLKLLLSISKKYCKDPSIISGNMKVIQIIILYMMGREIIFFRKCVKFKHIIPKI